MLELSGALTAARSILDVAKIAVDARDDAKLKAALTELQTKLFDATSAALQVAAHASTLQEQLDSVKRELRQIKAQAEERDRYALTEVRPGAYAYMSKAEDGGQSEPAHYLCQPCYDKGIKTVLRHSPQTRAWSASWDCPADKAHQIQLPYDGTPESGRTLISRGI